jgi:hypothetical protein
LLTGFCYRSSVQSKKFTAKENLLADESYKKSVQNIEEAVGLNNEKRAHYEQKYPELANKK